MRNLILLLLLLCQAAFANKFYQPVIIYNTTAASSPTSGALQVRGGLGVSGAGFFGGNLSVVTGANSSLLLDAASGGSPVVRFLNSGDSSSWRAGRYGTGDYFKLTWGTGVGTSLGLSLDTSGRAAVGNSDPTSRSQLMVYPSGTSGTNQYGVEVGGGSGFTASATVVGVYRSNVSIPALSGTMTILSHFNHTQAANNAANTIDRERVFGCGAKAAGGTVGNFACLTDATGWTGDWGVYLSTTNPNYLAGRTHLGSTPLANGIDTNLSIYRIDSTNGSNAPISLFADYTGSGYSTGLRPGIYGLIRRNPGGSVTDTVYFSGVNMASALTAGGGGIYTNATSQGWAMFRAQGLSINSGTAAITHFAYFRVDGDSIATGQNKYGLYVGSLSGGSSSNYSFYSVNAPAFLGAQAELRFGDSDSSNYVSLKAPATMGSNRALTLPDDYPSVSGHSLVGTTTGVLSWAAPSGTDEASEITNASLLFTPNSPAANAMVIALKTNGGSDPTVGSPVKIAFPSSTAGSGVYVQRSVTSVGSDLNLAIPATALLGHSNSVAENLYVYAIDNAGTVELAVSGSPVDERSLQSTTALDASADSIAGLYSMTSRASVPVRLLGIATVTNTTAGQWAAAPSLVRGSPHVHAIARMPKRKLAETAGIGGVARSNGTGSYSSGAAGTGDVTGTSVTLTTTGRPVKIMMQTANSGATQGQFQVSSAGARLRFTRGGSGLGPYTIGSTQIQMCPSLQVIDDAPAGTHTYALNIETNGGTVTFENCRLVAYEL